MNAHLVPGAAADWTAPTPGGPVRATVRPPGSKSITNRALVLAALAEGPTRISGALSARDTTLMADALRALGASVRQDSDPAMPDHGDQLGMAGSAQPVWLAEPVQPSAVGSDAEVDVGNAGTVLRFVPPVAALTTARVRFRGDERMAVRPVAPLLDALRELGARVDDGGTGAVPFVVAGTGAVAGGSVTLDASASSQLVSALLLAGSRFDRGVQIRHHGPPIPSAPHVEMTVRMLRGQGVHVEAEPGVGTTWRVAPGPLAGGHMGIEPDLSSAMPFLAAALATGGTMTIAGWPVDSLQPAGRIIELLTELGGTVTHTAEGLTVSGSGQINGITADLSEVGELTPVLTALAALASQPSEFFGVGHIRRHETDRLAALAGEIGKLGGDITELDDGLRIRPRPLRAVDAVFDSHDDHRLVMTAAVLGLVTPGLRVHNAATVGKTFPEFIGLWSRCCGSGR